jgi:hypothetical protein
MHFDQALDDRQPDPKPPLSANGLILHFRGFDPDVASWIGVFRCIGEQVRHALHEPHRVRMDAQRLTASAGDGRLEHPEHRNHRQDQQGKQSFNRHRRTQAGQRRLHRQVQHGRALEG